jgi:GT2 family glycosyltransferase
MRAVHGRILHLTSPATSNINERPVWVVVLHWQASHYTRACLATIHSLEYPNFKILLVDNGSPDNTGATIARQFPGVNLLRLEDNRGYAGGCNAAINYCIDEGAEWIWLLNNDTRIAEDTLDHLMSAATDHPEAGALGAMVYTGSGEEFVASGFGEIDFSRAKTYLRKSVPPDSKAVVCEWLSGSNLLLRVDAIKQSGFFDEDYFLYFEDTDICYRLCRAGWHCVLVPGARIEHIGGGSMEGERSFWRAYYYTRNRLLFFMRHLQGIAALPAVLAIGGHLVRHAMVLPFRGEDGRKQLRAEYLGLRDYLTHRLGKAKCLDWCETE